MVAPPDRFILLFLRVINSDVVLSREVFGFAFVAGLCLGAAILGRQTYLIVVPALVVLMFWLREKWTAVLICIMTALAVCSWVFALWHGLAPSHQYHRLTHSSVSFTNLLLSLSYAAVATVFLNPRWLAGQRPTVWIICTLCGFALAYFARNYEDPPAKSLLVHAFGMQLGLGIGFVVGCALGAIGAVWAWTTFKTFWRERNWCGLGVDYIQNILARAARSGPGVSFAESWRTRTGADENDSAIFESLHCGMLGRAFPGCRCAP